MSTIGQWTDKKMARRLGDAVSTTELPDADTGSVTGLNTLAIRAEAELAQVLNKDDWTSSDIAYPAVQEAATLLTATKILRALHSDDEHLDKMREMRREVDKIVESINRGPGAAGDNVAVLSASSDYVTRAQYQAHNPGSEFVQHYLSDF